MTRDERLGNVALVVMTAVFGAGMALLLILACCGVTA